MEVIEVTTRTAVVEVTALAVRASTIGQVTTRREVEFSGGFTLPTGTYDVDHLSPWGPTICATNDLGHQLVVPWAAVASPDKWTTRRKALAHGAGHELGI